MTLEAIPPCNPKQPVNFYDPSLVYIIAGKLSPLRCQNEGRLWNKRAKADDKFAVHKTADGLRQQSKLVDNQDMGLQFACRMSSSSHERVRSTADSSLLLRAFIFTVIGSLVKIILWPSICPSESFGLSAAASFQIFFCWKNFMILPYYWIVSTYLCI